MVYRCLVDVRGGKFIRLALSLAILVAMLLLYTSAATADGSGGDPKYSPVPQDTTKVTGILTGSTPTYGGIFYLSPAKTKTFHIPKLLWIRLSILYGIRQ